MAPGDGFPWGPARCVKLCAMPVVRGLRVLLRIGDFRRLLTVRLLSQAADGVYQVALASYVVFSPEKQTSATAIASAMAVLLLPYSLLGPFAGVLLDRWRRRQVLLYGNLARVVLAGATAALIVAEVPDALFYASALTVTAVNRFVLAGLSAALPRVVATDEQLVLGNSLSPTAGTLAATAAGGLAPVVRLAAPDGAASDALVILLGSALYLCAALAALRMPRDLLGPDPHQLQPGPAHALLSTAHGLLAGLRHLTRRPTAARALYAMTLMRFCYGALTVMVLMLCRYAWGDGDSDGLALLGLAAVLEPVLGLPFAPAPMMVAAFVLGLTTQGVKIATDTVVQSSVEDAYRGRVFSLYDVLFNVAFVGAAGVAALMLPPDGASVPLVLIVAALYLAAVSLVAFHVKHDRPRPDVSRETERRFT